MANSYARLTEQQLRQLLLEKEGPTLDFKREWYEIDKTVPQEKRNRQEGELIKDILSLANGNADVAGDMAYLVIGADDHLDADGNRRLRDVPDVVLPAKELVQKINSYCDPPFGHLYIDAFKIDECRLYVIVLPPSSLLYELKQHLKTKDSYFSERTVFVRHGEHVEVASTRERVTLLQIKRGRYRDSRNAPSWFVGASSGATVGGVLAYNLSDAITSMPSNLSIREKKLISGITGAGAGAVLGALIGKVENFAKETIIDWPRKPLWDKLLSLTPWIIGPLVGKLWSDRSKGRKSSSIKSK